MFARVTAAFSGTPSNNLVTSSGGFTNTMKSLMSLNSEFLTRMFLLVWCKYLLGLFNFRVFYRQGSSTLGRAAEQVKIVTPHLFKASAPSSRRRPVRPTSCRWSASLTPRTWNPATSSASTRTRTSSSKSFRPSTTRESRPWRSTRGTS